jgi:hypothetical protein
MLNIENINLNSNIRFYNLQRDLEDIEKEINSLIYDDELIHELNLKIISLEMRWDDFKIQNSNRGKLPERFDYLMRRINEIRIEFNQKFMISNKDSFKFKYKEISVEEKEMKKKLLKKVFNNNFLIKKKLFEIY